MIKSTYGPFCNSWSHAYQRSTNENSVYIIPINKIVYVVGLCNRPVLPGVPAMTGQIKSHLGTFLFEWSFMYHVLIACQVKLSYAIRVSVVVCLLYAWRQLFPLFVDSLLDQSGSNQSKELYRVVLCVLMLLLLIPKKLSISQKQLFVTFLRKCHRSWWREQWKYRKRDGFGCVFSRESLGLDEYGLPRVTWTLSICCSLCRLLAKPAGVNCE